MLARRSRHSHGLGEDAAAGGGGERYAGPHAIALSVATVGSSPSALFGHGPGCRQSHRLIPLTPTQ
jgi:hypothetical protein